MLFAVEAIAPGLVSVWFALGAIAAMIAAFFHATILVQLVCFVGVTTISLALTRPFAKKYVNGLVQPTNADRVLSRDCVVHERIDNLNGTGAVAADGKVWTARMLRGSETAEVGEIVVARKIDGVKLLVEKRKGQASNTANRFFRKED